MKIKPKKFIIFDSDALKNFHKRIFFSIIVFIFFYSVGIFKISNEMIFQNISTEVVKDKINIDRGKIYDRNQLLLATNIYNYSLSSRNHIKIKNKKLLAEKLSKILSLEKSNILAKLNSKKNFIYIKKIFLQKNTKK